jgi:glycosyltransferase involved in cell wall biosynthesis
VSTATPNRQRWHRRREKYDFYSLAAWDRNTRGNAKLVDAALKDGDRILQIGGLYYPHSRFRDHEYYLFFTYTMRLALSDGISPWVVESREADEFLERERELYAHARHIFVAAKFVKDHLIAEYGIPEDRITVAGMGVDGFYLDHRPADAPRQQSRTALFVGFTWELKGGPTVMRAFAKARKVLPDLQLRVVGPTPRPEMYAAGVSVLGPVRDRQALLAHYRAADLFLLPSRCDSFGFVFLEAMSQGVVCIGSRLNAMPEIIQEGVTGFIVDPEDDEALARKIVAFYDHQETRASFGERAIRRVHDLFTWPRVGGLILAGMGMLPEATHSDMQSIT